MRVFMLGWEFPPFISGGLGTACYGLTKAMSRRGMDVTFVLPKTIDSEYSSHVKLLAPQAVKAAFGDRSPESVASTYEIEEDGHDIANAVASGHRRGAQSGMSENIGMGEGPDVGPGAKIDAGEFKNVTFKAVPAKMISPYQSAGGEIHNMTAGGGSPSYMGTTLPWNAPQADGDAGGQNDPNAPISVLQGGSGKSDGSGGSDGSASPAGPDYCGDLIAESKRYAGLCVDLARGSDFDVVHAHDWLTFPAGMAVSAALGKPLIVHVHSTEFDRAGENIHKPVYEIERRGMLGAMKVVCVSYLTASIVQHRYGIDPAKIEVVYNGIESSEPTEEAPNRAVISKGDKVVLYLGRVTMQKGPEYFVKAAKRVLEKIDKVKFVIAGSGDKIKEIIELAAREGIGHKVLFTGFLRGKDVERVFKMADVYVMPSVSEPFGIAPLEAISHDVPVIISKQSGVSEVLNHALKVDFWDTDEMANKIIAVLRHPPLSATLREQADLEVRQLTWDGAASRCEQVYEGAMDLMPV